MRFYYSCLGHAYVSDPDIQAHGRYTCTKCGKILKQISREQWVKSGRFDYEQDAYAQSLIRNLNMSEVDGGEEKDRP